MNAGRILRETGLYTDELRVTLHPLEPDEINVWPASRYLRALWRAGIRGVTIRRLVLVDPELFESDRRRLARLVIHELVHVRQFSDQGYLSFMTRYIGDYLRGRLRGMGHRDAYLEIPAEVEARQIQQRLTT